MGRLIDADELEKIMTEDWFLDILLTQTGKYELKKNLVNMIDSVPLAYDVDKAVEEIENINTTWNCQECIHLETCDKIQIEKGSGSEHLDLCAEVVKVLSKEIIRKGGVE